MTQLIAPGAEAPDFELPSAPDRKVSLSELFSPIDVNPGADGILESLDKMGGER